MSKDIIEKKVKITVDSDKAKKDLNDVNDSVRGLKDNFSLTSIASNGLSGTLKSLGSGIKLITKAAWGFIATPIGAIIAAIVLAATALYSIFKSFKPVTDKIEQAFAAISAVGELLKNVFLNLITGSKNLKESFNGLGKSIKEVAIEAAELKKIEQELEEQQKALEVSNKQAEANINKLIVQSKNRSLTEKERIKLNEEAMAIEQEMFRKNKEIADKEYDWALRKLVNNKRMSEDEIQYIKDVGVAAAFELQNKYDLKDKEIELFKNAQLKMIDVQNQSTQLQEKSQNRIDALLDQQLAKQQKAKDDALKKYEDQQNEEVLLLKNSLLEKGILGDEMNKILEAQELEHLQKLINYYKKLGLDTTDLELQLVDKKLSINQKEYDKKIEQAKEYQKNINAISNAISDEEKKLKEDLNSWEKEFEDQQIQDSIDATAKEHEEYIKKLDFEKEKELKLADLRTQIYQQSMEAIKLIDQTYVNFKTNLLNNQLKSGQISQEKYDKELAKIQKNAAIRQKAFAVAETIINTAATIMGIWKDFPKNDYGLAATIGSIAAGILGASQIATILSTPIDGSSMGTAPSGIAGGAVGASTAPNTSFSFSPTPEVPKQQQVIKTYVLGKDVKKQSELDYAIIRNGVI